MNERYIPPVPEETLEILERRVRKGLGPESSLIEILKDGIVTEEFIRSDMGRVLIRDVTQRCTNLLTEMLSDVANLTPEQAFRQQLALSQELGILRRVAALIAGGRMAETRIVEREDELEAHGGPTRDSDGSS